MAEAEQKARLASIEGETNDSHFATRFGRIAAFAYSLGVPGFAFFAIHKGYPGGAAMIVGLHVAGVCAKLISDRRHTTHS